MLAARLGAIRGVKAVGLGGSHARGLARPGSDIDLGILYSDADPFSIASIRELVLDLNDTAKPVVTGFYEWGAWVNGGAWLTIRGDTRWTTRSSLRLDSSAGHILARLRCACHCSIRMGV